MLETFVMTPDIKGTVANDSVLNSLVVCSFEAASEGWAVVRRVDIFGGNDGSSCGGGFGIVVASAANSFSVKASVVVKEAKEVSEIMQSQGTGSREMLSD